MKQWYTLYTKANNEYQVASLLQEQGIETFLPTLNTSDKQEPLFPCYLFMKADLTKLPSTSWQWTPGLRRIVSRGQQPVPVSTEIIQLIKDNLIKLNEQIRTRQQHKFVPGEKVRVVNGPFKEMVAIFSESTSPGARVRILMSVLGQQKRIQLDVHDIEPVTADAGTNTSQHSKRPRRTRGRGRHIKCA